MLTAKSRIYINIVNSDVGVTVTRNGGFKCELQKMDAYFLVNADFASKSERKEVRQFFHRLYSWLFKLKIIYIIAERAPLITSVLFSCWWQLNKGVHWHVSVLAVLPYDSSFDPCKGFQYSP